MLAAIRELVETTHLPQLAIAARVGVSVATVSRWRRREGWVRPAAGAVLPALPEGPAVAPPTNPRFRRRRGAPYVPDVVEAVRVLVEGTGLTLQEIADRAGIGSATVSVWIRRRGWTRPLDASRCTRWVAAERAGLGGRFAAGYRRVAALAEGEARRLAEAGEEGGAVAAARQLAAAARRAAGHHDRTGRVRLPAVAADAGSGLVRLSLRPTGPRHHPRPDGLFARARALVEGTTWSHTAIAAQLGINPATLSGWIGDGGWRRPPGAPGPFGGQRRTPRRAARMLARGEACDLLGAAERRLEAGERETGAGLAAAEGALVALERAVVALRLPPRGV